MNTISALNNLHYRFYLSVTLTCVR